MLESGKAEAVQLSDPATSFPDDMPQEALAMSTRALGSMVCCSKKLEISQMLIIGGTDTELWYIPDDEILYSC